jgi:Kef-type K+ transport system membrane component KefB
LHISTRTLVELATIFGLLVVPRALQRFRLPAPLTCFAFGIIIVIFFKEFAHSRVIATVATFGIASLFLLAGLEVDFAELRRQLPRLSGHIALRGLLLAVSSLLIIRFLHMPWQPATLFALGLLTPSTGFILDTLPQSGLIDGEQAEVALDAISGEISAILVLFVVSQAGSIQTLAVRSFAVLLLIVLTPLLFLALGKYVVPYAPGSEFSLLLMAGIICAVITQTLGIHYLVGAFAAGLIASLLRTRIATLASSENLHAVRLFASFFIPFYFFREGLEVPAGALVVKALFYGLAFSLVIIPVRFAKNWLRARYLSHRSSMGATRVAVALTPTLIFTLVIAGVLSESFHIDDALFGGLLVYAAISTILPSFVLPRLTGLPA